MGRVPYKDIREYMDLLDQAGLLKHVKVEVDLNGEIGAISARVFTEPLRCTTLSSVVTAMSKSLSEGSLKIAVFTFVVIAASSM